MEVLNEVYHVAIAKRCIFICEGSFQVLSSIEATSQGENTNTRCTILIRGISYGFGLLLSDKNFSGVGLNISKMELYVKANSRQNIRFLSQKCASQYQRK